MAIRIDRVVTRGGDGGETSLGTGDRVRKDSRRIAAVGAVDELNAALGVLRACGLSPGQDAAAARIQNDLFDLGADLAFPGTDEARLRVTSGQCARLEQEIAGMNGTLPALTSFVLPGGTMAAAQAHVARTIARRAERETVALATEEALNAWAVRYLNRLSDHLFVLSRALNDGGARDVLWVPGGTR
jgi:cob(I)alamin adenosyltransferase